MSTSSFSLAENDETSLSLNDDLVSVRHSRRSMDSSSMFTSFRPSLDDSTPELGLNRLSIARVSPLGPNSIFELVADVDKRPSTLSPNVGRRKKLSILGPTQKDIPPIQLSKVEKAPKELFTEYLTQVGKEYERYNANRKLTASTLQSLTQSVGANGDMLEPEKDALDTIPQVFFAEQFNLDDPRIFKLVTEGVPVASMNESLQEKISWYLDTIEIHLVNEISKSSGSFFDALNDLKEISETNSKTVRLINELKRQLQVVKDHKIAHNLERAKLQRQRENVAKLEQGLVQVTEVVLQTDSAERLLHQSEYDQCLDKVDYVESLIRGQADSKLPYPLIDLRGVQGLAQHRERLHGLRSMAGQSYSKIFGDFLLTDLRAHYEDIQYPDSLGRLIKGTGYTKQVEDSFRDKLTDYIIGLVRSNEIAAAFKNYEEAVISEMKNIVRVFLPNEDRAEVKDSVSSQSSATNRPPSLSALIKVMKPREFEVMLIKIFTTVSEGLRRLTVHQKLLMDLALTYLSEDQSSLITQLDIRGSITKSIEIIQIRMGKIIAVRKDLTSTLRYDYFLRFYYINSKFLEECENISGSTFKYLPDILAQQIKSFNSSFQHTNLKRVSQALEIEEWKPIIVAPDMQQFVNKITEGHKLDTEKPWRRELSHLDDIAPNDQKEDKSSHKRSIVVGDKTFVASQSLLTTLTIIEDVLVLRENFNQLSTVYEGNMVELVEYYKSRALQGVKKPDGTVDKDKNISIVNESLDCLSELLDCTRESQRW